MLFLVGGARGPATYFIGGLLRAETGSRARALSVYISAFDRLRNFV